MSKVFSIQSLSVAFLTWLKIADRPPAEGILDSHSETSNPSSPIDFVPILSLKGISNLETETSSNSTYHLLPVKMASNRIRRIAKELADIESDSNSQIFCQPRDGNDGDLTNLQASFMGPPDTPYEGGTYIVDVKVPNEYPFRPPIMKFATKLWHPNVSSQTVGYKLQN